MQKQPLQTALLIHALPFCFALPGPKQRMFAFYYFNIYATVADHARLQRKLFLEQIGVDRQRIPAVNPGNEHGSFQDSLLGSLPEVTSVL